MADKSTSEIGAQLINRFHGTLASSAAVDLATATLPPSERSKLNPEVRTFKIIEMLEKVEELAFEKDITEDERKARSERLDQIVGAFIEDSIIKNEDVPDNHFQNQLRLLRERGHGELEINDDIKKQEIERIKNEQRAGLRTWTDYLLSDDARSAYPETWFRFYVLKNISELKSVDKQKATYPKRDKNYVGVFPELNQEVLSNLYKHVKKVAEIQFEEKAIAGLKKDEVIERRRALGDVKRELDDFGQLAYQGRFGQLYYNLADRQREQQLTALKERGMSGTEGEWKTFAQGSGADELVKSLEGRGTGWCIAGEETASNYLEQGDIHIYYTKDSDGKPILPRVAVRMENGSVAEVRGVNSDQNLESEFIDIAKQKYEKLPGGSKYDKKVNDMRKLTEIDKKVRKNFDLDGDEIKFLYEAGNEIEGFGYEKDPRIYELKQIRKEKGLSKNDYAVVYNVGIDQVAETLSEIDSRSVVFASYETISLAKIREVNKGELKIIFGEIGRDYEDADLKSLLSLDKVDGYSSADYFSRKITGSLHEDLMPEVSELLSGETLTKLRMAGTEPEKLPEDPEVNFWTEVLVKYMKLNGFTDVTNIKYIFYGGDLESRYFLGSLSEDNAKAIEALLESNS